MASTEGKKITAPPAFNRQPGDVFRPKYTLTGRQTETLVEFRANLVDLDPSERSYCDDACLCRFLRARDWKLSQAEKLLRDMLKWRREYKPEDISPDVIYEENATGKNYFHGFDRFKRPVMYQRPLRQNTKHYVNQVKLVVYMLEREVNAMDITEGVEQHVIFIDFKGYSVLNAPPMHVTKEVLSILMDKFPERLGNAFLVDAPMLFTFMYRIIRPFLPEATQKKLHFITRSGTAGRNGNMHPVLAEYFDDDDLEEEYGGNLPSTYNHEYYMENERAVWEAERAKRATASELAPSAAVATSRSTSLATAAGTESDKAVTTLSNEGCADADNNNNNNHSSTASASANRVRQALQLENRFGSGHSVRSSLSVASMSLETKRHSKTAAAPVKITPC